MVVLTESSLNKRHREFNRKLNEAVVNNVNFDDVKAEGNESDIDNLFKIELASRYKNIDYILESLKSGDSLYVSRALKCTWMFDSEYSHIINPQFINDNIFPHLSLKSKKKLINAISVHVRDAQRALEFYEFCKCLEYNDIRLKFLLFTNEETKIKLVHENYSLINNSHLKYFFKIFIGNSFNLANICLEKLNESKRKQALYELRYLYSQPNIGTKYLDLLESYTDTTTISWNENLPKYGLRMSKHVILKHKDRVYNKPLLYTNRLNKTIMVQYSTVDDAKYYTAALMPDNAKTFWSVDYYNDKRHFFDIIPKEEKYQFIKQIFNDKYPGEPFEMSFNFYNLKYYNLISDLKLKEEWALSHIASEKEILGAGKKYFWYRFIEFEKSFDEIKKYVTCIRNPHIRAEIINVLVESAKNDRELETLFNYYYERHINEDKLRKESFVDAVNQHHNIFNFDSECFAALDKIYYSIDVYNILEGFYHIINYKVICFIYRVIHNIEMPDAMIKFMDYIKPRVLFKRHRKNLMLEQKSAVIDYLMEYYLKKINYFNDKPYDESIQNAVQRYVKYVLDLMQESGKLKTEIPEVVMKYVYLEWNRFKFHPFFGIPRDKLLTQDDLLRYLKQDTSKFISKFPELKQYYITPYCFTMNRIVRKIRIYFSDDLTVKFSNLCKDILNDSNVYLYSVKIIVFGIIHLADKEYLVEFMTKHIPADPKINHIAIDRKLLSIQSAICSLAGYARPPAPLPLILKYISGDYTQYCLPIFNMYMANLQPKLCMEFINSVIDTPLSIQKHGIRLAFKVFSIHDLSILASKTWKQTNNVSLRFIIYKSLHSKITEVNNKNAKSLFEILNKFTSSLHEEDDDELYDLVTSNTMPEAFRHEHLKTTWKTLLNLPCKLRIIRYRSNALMCLGSNISNIHLQDFIKNIVEEHIPYLFDRNKDGERYKLLQEGRLIRNLWHLIARYLLYSPSAEGLEEKLNLIKIIISKCTENWNEEIDGVKFRNLFTEFVYILKLQNTNYDGHSYRCDKQLFEVMLKKLIDSLPMEEIYQITWNLRLYIRTRDIKINTNNTETDEHFVQVYKEASIKLGKICVALVKEYIEKNMFWIVFCDDIRDIITSEADIICRNLGINYAMKVSEMLVVVCNELIQLRNFETLFLVSNILQNQYEINEAEYRNVVEQLKSFDDPQFKSFYQININKDKKGSTFI